MAPAVRGGGVAMVAVVGATATGKTPLAERLAGSLAAEIVCCDSRQVFAGLEIGTGKPTPAERSSRPHHLFDALALGEAASAGWYAREAGRACEAIRGRGRLPLLVGGTGLYLKALARGLAPTPPHDPAVRERLRSELEARGPEALHARLAAVDPDTAARVGPRDRQRIGRALEVFESTGRPLSWWHRRTPEGSGQDWTVLELVARPAFLAGRIARRTAWMFDSGLIEETCGLLDAGHGGALRALRAIGYDETMDLIAGRVGREEAEAAVNRRTAQLAKRQRTWFRHQTEAVRLDIESGDGERIVEAALQALRAAGVAG